MGFGGILKGLLLILILLFSLFIIGCEDNKSPLFGGGKDEHGCIGTAGYSWCEIKDKCLRTWEEPCVDDSKINNFVDCENAGYAIMESYPRQCKISQGDLFTEIIDDENNSSNSVQDEFCGSSTFDSCASDSDCTKGGCSGQICEGVNLEGLGTTCEYKDCYNAVKYSKLCRCEDFECQWVQVLK
jgi:eight-cysteine-cluster-containing protein